MSLRQQLIKSFMSVGAMYMLGIPVGLLSNIILARTLGPELFGQYAFAMALFALLSIPVSAGIPQLMTRQVATYAHGGQWQLYRGAVRAAHLWVMGASLLLLIMYAVAGPLADWLPADGKWALLGIVILLVPLQGLNAARNGTIKGLGYPAVAEMPTKMIQPLLLLATLAALAAMGGLTASRALWMQVGVGALTFVIASILFLRIRPSSAYDSQPAYKPAAWLTALLPFTLISLVGTFSGQVGIVLLGVLGNDETVAALRVAERCAQVVAISLALVNMVISPHIVKTYHEGNTQRLQQLSQKTARGAFLIALPISLVLILLGKPILKLLFGIDYVEIAYLPMAILVLGQLFNVAMGSVGILLAMSGHEKLTLSGQIAGLGTIIVSALVLIPFYQQTGAALAVTAGLLVWNSVLGFGVSRKLKIRPGIF